MSVHGERGRAWLEALPALLDDIAREWRIEIREPFALSYNYVTRARTHDGADVVLKVGVPSQALANEIAALRHFDGRGAVRLIAADVARGAMLLERVIPGDTLKDVDDDESATAIAADVMRAMWRPPPSRHDFPTVAEWGQGFTRLRQHFRGGTGPLPARLVAMAEHTYGDLVASSAPPVLLHGDLHHENMLHAANGRWLAIDPQGVVGEPVYDTGALLRNPHEWLAGAADPARLLSRRVTILAERLGFDRQRILDWAMAQAVLSAWWHIEDHEAGGIESAIAVAEVFADMR
ncbi:MAG: aminoglycoside phosphotransferase family protein [Dehalococcoidia bacterium]